jgi:predicted nucleotidyltransferase
VIDPVSAARRFFAENEQERTVLLRRRTTAAELGEKLAIRILESHPETRRVWGFGSTFETWRNYRMTSDIDLAIESGNVLDILPLVEREEFSVDLVDLSTCDPVFAAFVREQGTVLAEIRE